MSISEIAGCGSQRGWKESAGDLKKDILFLPKIKVEIVVTEEEAETVVDKICEAALTGETGHGKIFISEIAYAVRIRTKERRVAAIR